MTSKEAWEILKELPPSWSGAVYLLDTKYAIPLYKKNWITVRLDEIDDESEEQRFIRRFTALQNDKYLPCCLSELGQHVKEDPISAQWSED